MLWTSIPLRVHAVLDPVTIQRKGGFARIETADGGADIYGLDTTHGLMVNHASGAAIWDLLVDVARAGHLTIMPMGCATCIVDEAARADLPEGFPGPVQVIQTGAALLRVIEPL
jgi:hypothetical protein